MRRARIAIINSGIYEGAECANRIGTSLKVYNNGLNNIYVEEASGIA